MLSLPPSLVPLTLESALVQLDSKLLPRHRRNLSLQNILESLSFLPPARLGDDPLSYLSDNESKIDSEERNLENEQLSLFPDERTESEFLRAARRLIC